MLTVKLITISPALREAGATLRAKRAEWRVQRAAAIKRQQMDAAWRLRERTAR